mmetsp:Transcript_24221/g.58491  ORF Transcript_24221/g.58491 Transcript_24221/m.58491 type:complete len:1044 (+) Transcript_24221:240-3371(+)
MTFENRFGEISSEPLDRTGGREPCTQKHYDDSIPLINSGESGNSKRERIKSSDRCGGLEQGLTDEAARILLSQHGPNEVDTSAGWVNDLLQGLTRLICNPLIGLLAALGILSFLTGDYSTGTVISVMALVSICLSAYHQFSAEKAARALSEGFSTDARVLRGPFGRTEQTIPSRELVPGDMVLISAGDLIPADLKMITASRLLVNQSILTGESEPVLKRVNSEALKGKQDQEPIDFKEHEVCFMGTHVESGSALGRVIATGEETRAGQMADSLKGLRPRSAFDKGVDKFGALMLKFTLIMCPLVFMIQTLKNGFNSEGFLYAVSVGVGLTPEMLPVVVTFCMALGAIRLSKTHGVIVKHLDSLPTLGQLDVLCVDKTGTLTRDAAQVQLSLTLNGSRNPAPLRIARLHSLHQTGIKNAVERAVLEAEESNYSPVRASLSSLTLLRPGVQPNILKEWPFDFDRRRASILLGSSATQNDSSCEMDSLLIMKGAPNEVMRICATYFIDGTDVDVRESCALSSAFNGHSKMLDLEAITRARATIEEWESEGLRAIAVAAAVGPAKSLMDGGENERDKKMCLLGFLFLADPPKESASSAIASLKRLGIDVKVLTGDSPKVTRHVCVQVGLIQRRAHSIGPNGAPATEGKAIVLGALPSPNSNEIAITFHHDSKIHESRNIYSMEKVITGKDISEMNDVVLAERVMKGVIFARLQPLQKERIVKVLKSQGLAVGFLGDGVNDCAALRAADVGVSVDTGLDVAKSAADVILVDKSLMALDSCVRSGRLVFANVIKYVKMAASSNWGNMFSVIGASLFLPFVPMLPLQLVAGNLLYDFAQLSIPTDNVPEWHMTQPLVWDVASIARFVLLLGPVSSIFDFITFYIAFWQLGGRENPSIFRTAWFVEGILSQLFIVFILRSAVPETSSRRPIPLLKPPQEKKTKTLCFLMPENGPSLTLVVVTSTMGIIAIILSQTPLIGNEFEFVPLPRNYWPWLILILILYGILTSGLMHTVLPRLLHSRFDKSGSSGLHQRCYSAERKTRPWQWQGRKK